MVVEPLDASAGDKTMILDGGVSDNTGIDTIYELICGLESTSHPAGKRVLRLLRRRQIALVEIDSGAKPTPPTALDRLFAVVLEPIQALNNAGYTNADHAKDQYVDAVGDRLSLRRDYEQESLTDAQRKALRLLDDNITNITPIAVRCNHFSLERPDRNAVMTAWALGPNDKANVIARFAFEIDRLDESLRHVEELGRDFLVAKEELYRVFPDQTANLFVADIAANQDFANSLAAKLPPADTANLTANQQAELADAIRPYQQSAAQVAIAADEVEQAEGEWKNKVRPDQLKRWSRNWRDGVKTKLPNVAVEPPPPNIALKPDWKQSVAAQTAPDSRPDVDLALKRLDEASQRMEFARRKVQTANQQSKNWFVEQKAPPKP
jgi:hypothetical protein